MGDRVGAGRGFLDCSLVSDSGGPDMPRLDLRGPWFGGSRVRGLRFLGFNALVRGIVRCDDGYE